MLRNTHFSQLRAHARRAQTVPLPDELGSRAPDTQLEAGELYAAISQLPADFRDVLVAIDVAGLSYREAARTLKVREATITTRLHRARQRLVRALSGD